MKNNHFTITEGTTDKSGKACFIVKFNGRLSSEDFKTFCDFAKPYKAIVNGKFSPYNVSTKVMDLETLTGFLNGFKYSKTKKAEKAENPAKPSNPLQRVKSKAVNKYNPKKTAKNDLQEEGIDANLFAQFQAFLQLQKELQ